MRRELVLREENVLVFPSQSTKDNSDLPDPKGKAVVFEFQGAILNIYTTLFLEGITWVDFRQQGLEPMKRLIWGITGERDRLSRF